MRTKKVVLAALAGALGIAAPAQAGIVASHSTGAPPATLGGYALQAWPDDGLNDFDVTSTIPAIGGAATSNRDLQVRTIGDSWATAPWGGVYSGRVYWTGGTGDPLVLTLPEPVGALQFQAEANAFGSVTIEAIADDGTSSGPVAVQTGSDDAGEAATFGFHGTGGDQIAAVEIRSGNDNDLGVGNFSSAGTPPADTTPPSVVPHVSGTEGANGWYMSDVAVSFEVSDAESAVQTSGCGDVTVSTDTTGDTFTCTATSDGGTTERSVTVQRDTVAPEVTLTCPASVPLGEEDSATWSATDATSGIAGADSGSATIPASGEAGVWAFSLPAGTATDVAGNGSAEQTCSYRVPLDAEALFGPRGTAKAGSAIPLKFRVPGSTEDPVASVTSRRVDCATGDPLGAARRARGDLHRNGGRWNFVWETRKRWAGTCREVSVNLVGGGALTAVYRFK